MEVNKLNLYECKHCTGTGTCTTGHNQDSCRACIQRAEIPFWRRKNQTGLICGVCSGLGITEPTTDRMNKRIAPVLAIYLTGILLGLLTYALIMESQYFTELLAFSSAIIGSVVGYYFSNKK
ncbi:molecular chaperone DnaJ [Photobacterium leiognathi]|uniref:molecular chaperone DnaJ n=1 Tax=Photobacterium leiognathi TaxID=553611 RepID=UPI000B007AC6|nr:molecular chaperone DnaJ [Photobacterium leiognathi]